MLGGLIANNMPGRILRNLDREWVSIMRTAAVTTILYIIAIDIDIIALKEHYKSIIKLDIINF